MTIKKQLLGLSFLIITIPVLCVLYIFIHNYLQSPDRLLIHGYKEIRNINKYNLTDTEWNQLYKFITNMPPESEAACIDENLFIIFSNFNELKSQTKITENAFFELFSNTSKDYFYQFTTIPIESQSIFFITRIPRVKQNKRYKQHLIFNLLIFLFIVVGICSIIVVLIFVNIDHSITILKKTTKNIANGDLSNKIETKNNKNEITEISNYLEKMRESLLEAQQHKNNFIMGISHDLRTPVSIIKGYTEGLIDGIFTDEAEKKHSLELILNKSNQLEEMVDTLINLTKLNSFTLKETLIPLSITDFIMDYTNQALLTGTVFKRNITSKVSFTKNISICFNKQLIYRVFENLYGNALRYTNENDSITFESYNTNDKVIFKIIDTGCGISENDLKNIFELFYRGTTSRREEGMGIGLSVVKNIIETHGWNIDVTSELHKGSCFTIEIPYNNL